MLNTATQEAIHLMAKRLMRYTFNSKKLTSDEAMQVAYELWVASRPAYNKGVAPR